jgi:plasmid stabilization system protein ParE
VNKPYTILISARAEAAFARAEEWWRANRPTASNLLVEEFEAAAQQIARAPYGGASYPSRSAREIRRWLLPGTRYHVYYRVDEASRTVTIRTLWHAMRGRAPRL